MWGAGKYRESDVYLAIAPAASFASGAGTLYFSGLSNGQPMFVAHERGARAVVQNGTVGDVSVTYVRELRQWIMLYDSRTPRGIVFRHSAVPWGPFADEQTIFSAKDGLGLFIHDPAHEPPDGLAGPVIGAKNKQHPEAVPGGAYAPYAVQRWTKLNGNTLAIYFLLSTWNPYTVVLMRSEFQVQR